MAEPAAHRILIVDDDANERQSMARLLQGSGYQVSTAESADKALGYLEEAVDFVVTDLRMGDVSGMDLLRHWKLKQPETMFLMVTGHGNTQTAIDAIKAGAYHYMTKPVDVNALLIMLQNMVRQRTESAKVRELQNRLNEKFSMSSIIGRSPQMQRVFELIRRSAMAMSTVLILGESGTGKELVAQAIHQNSPRRDGPFIAVNCAAMPATLVESELFGHEKGAFTGATDRRIGRFESAHGGTLFIDEIGDFEVSLQVKLLRALETRVVAPIGGHKELKIDTRVVAATSRDIAAMMAQGEFRKDLYYRLNVITIELPPLRNRLDDVPLLVKRFMDRVNQQNGTAITAISPDLVDALQQYRWPGNVRELLNVIERMMVLSDRGQLDVADLPSYIRQVHGKPGVAVSNELPGLPDVPAHGPAAPSGPAVPDAATPSRGTAPPTAAAPPTLEQALAHMTLAELEDRAIAAALERLNHNRTRAARALGISVRTLQRKLGAKHAQQADQAEGPNPPGGAPATTPGSPANSDG